MRLILQFCLLLLVLLGTETHAWGKVDIGQNIASGGLPMFLVDCTDGDAPPALITQGEPGPWGYEPAPDVCNGPNLYAYVQQNPWSKFDPLGLEFFGTNEGNETPVVRQTIQKHHAQNLKGLANTPRALKDAIQNIPKIPGRVWEALKNPAKAWEGFKQAANEVVMNPEKMGETTGTFIVGGAISKMVSRTRGVPVAPEPTAPTSGAKVTAAVAAAEADNAATTTLYRAVGPDELADISNTQQLVNRGSAEGKYFTTSSEQASNYAKQAVKAFGDEPYTTVKTSVPSASLPAPVSVDGGIPAYVVPNESLPALKPTILDTMDLPPSR